MGTISSFPVSGYYKGNKFIDDVYLTLRLLFITIIIWISIIVFDVFVNDNNERLLKIISKFNSIMNY